MEGVEVTWRHALMVWWSWCWRAVLVALGFGFVFGVIADLFGRIFGLDMMAVRTIATFIAWIGGIGINIYFIKYVLSRKTFKQFKIILVPLESESHST